MLGCVPDRQVGITGRQVIFLEFHRCHIFWRVLEMCPQQVEKAADFFSEKIPGVKSALVRSQLRVAGQISLDLSKPEAADTCLGVIAWHQ